MSLQQLLYKRLRIEGSTHRSRSEKYQADSIERFAKEVLPDISGVDGPGRMKAYVHTVCLFLIVSACSNQLLAQVFPWTKIQDATRILETNTNIGKVVAEIVE